MSTRMDRSGRSQNSNGSNTGADGNGTGNQSDLVTPPAITLPKGGGAIRSIGEKFGTNPVTGTGTLSVPLPTSTSRSGFGPQLALSYDSGTGNGPFGFGWSLALPAITRKTDRGLPRYRDAEESDVFILSGVEDLVPVLLETGSGWQRDTRESPDGVYTIQRYRPRIEGLFARIERWTRRSDGDTHWRSISGDNITTMYGKDQRSRIADPANPANIFSWLICQSFDDQGNAMVYEYVAENASGIDPTQVNERNRLGSANRYLKRIRYGNRTPNRDANWNPFDPEQLADSDWLFENVLDYDEDHYEELALDPGRPAPEQHLFVRASATPGSHWTARPDPFSFYRAGFEIRTYRRCRRALLFHRFAELGDQPCLVHASEFMYADLDYTQPVPLDAELAYPGSTRFASFIQAIIQSGYVRAEMQAVLERNGARYVTYLKKSLPPLEFSYSKAAIQDELRELDPASLENLPVGIDGTAYQWIDLDGEGLAGILTEQAGAWFYKRNLGDGQFGALETVAVRPSRPAMSSSAEQLLDLTGDGLLDLVALDGPLPGFFERAQDASWQPFRPFRHLPAIDWHDPNLRLVDLDGDGYADVLITESELFTWHRSLAEAGFAPAQQVRQPLDEERGPRLLLTDGTQSVYLADMSGDGLTDLVRIRNGEVCYWPNLGYGRFGARVCMDNPPLFDHPDQFDQRRIRLADIDGSGSNDILYLGQSSIRIYCNQSGNRWSDPRFLTRFPHAAALSEITTADLLGNGTACLVWSSPLPARRGLQIRYIDLMGGQKPHLLVGVANNQGAETRIQYASSTRFYLTDKAAGTPWITRLPFPVHVVERVETYDRIGRTRFVTRYSYHHGYFDGVEREFRGFGRIEQWDTEEFAALNSSDVFPTATNVDASSHVPPLWTRTWFHTGSFSGRRHVSDFFAGLVDERDTGEYYREPGLSDTQARQLLLPDSELPDDLTGDEEREACRSLKGALLRQEVYALDSTDKAAHPYTVTEHNYTVRRVQPKAGQRHAIFFTHARESLSYHYERQPQDPRIAHTLTLEVDASGNVLKSVSIGYGRRNPDPELEPADRQMQARLLLTYSEKRMTNAVDAPDHFRTPVTCETRNYELTGYTPTGPAGRFQFSDVVRQEPAGIIPIFDSEIVYEAVPMTGRQRRPIRHERRLFRPDDLGSAANDALALLPLGTLEPMGFTGETYTLAFTPGLLAQVYRRAPSSQPPQNLLPDPAAVLAADIAGGQTAGRGGYVDLDGDGRWWIPSGRIMYSPPANHSAAEELAFARQHFFLPHRYRDQFGQSGTISYEVYNLLLAETVDALGNRVTVGERSADGLVTIPGNDYRVLQPRLVMDPNRNRSAIAFDALGMVVATAAMGKPDDNPQQGDRLDSTFHADLTEAETAQFFANPTGPQPGVLLGNATTRIVYDPLAYWHEPDLERKPPTFAATLLRETHTSDPIPDGGVQIQVSFAFMDGLGREIQKKMQAEPESSGPDTGVSRWVGSGWTILNNKGKPVRQYEPFFSATHRFEFASIAGVSPVLFYDPVGRVVATLYPNHTWQKVVFNSWRQESWDVSDTVLIAGPADDPDAGAFFRRLPDADYLPTWHAQRESGALGPAEQAAARKTAIHAQTPLITHLDTLGRTFLTIAHNRFKRSDSLPTDPPTEEFHPMRVLNDIEGNLRAVRDAMGRLVVRYDYGMLSQRIHQASMEAGERWLLSDVTGKPLYTWDSRDHQIQNTFDPLRRVTESFVQDGSSAKRLVERVVYGESIPNPEARNLRGKIVQHFDQAGTVTNDGYDFKGNLLQSIRRLASEYTTTLDWSLNVTLEAETFASGTRYDALNRPAEMTMPDSSVIRPGYNVANLLERVEVQLPGAASAVMFVRNLDYNARAQRTLIEYGNGATTGYEYDPLTFRLVHLQTLRDTTALQDLRYTYDPIGNITAIRDDAQQTVYFRNRQVEPGTDYTYDALSRLIEAMGREHLGQTGGQPNPPTPPDPFDGLHTRRDHPEDGNAMGRYAEQYVYDAAGNILTLHHRGSDPAQPGWTRAYAYQEASLLEPATSNNRLSSTSPGNNPAQLEQYRYDEHGNLTAMPHLSLMQWDYRDQLQATAEQVVANGGSPETTWYVYDAAGQRVRKVTERQASAGQNQARMKERIYLGGFEIYREYNGNGSQVTLERETLHIMDDKQRIALVETRTQGSDPAPQQLIRYQLGNHLGSASLELDDRARIISYEEYYPYGSTSYQGVRSQTETAKRYRYSGKERDEETGLYYYGARYYASWLGRWTSTDPAGIRDAPNAYLFTRANPVVFIDPNGQDTAPGPAAGATRTSIIQDFAEVVEYRYTRGLAVMGNNYMINFLIELGERAGAACSKNESAEVVFDRGAIIFASRFHLERVYSAAVARGEQVIADMDARQLRRYADGSEMTSAQHKAAVQRQYIQLQMSTLSNVEGSFFGAVGAGITGVFTDDPVKINAGSGLGTAFGGMVDAFGGMAGDRANLPVLAGSRPDVTTPLETLVDPAKPIAVGLSFSPITGHRPGLVGRFADKVGATTYWDIYGEGKDSATTVLNRMKEQFAQRSIVVNLSGLEQVEKFGVERGLAEIVRHKMNFSTTEAEINTAFSVKEFFAKTTFYWNGQREEVNRDRVLNLVRELNKAK